VWNSRCATAPPCMYCQRRIHAGPAERTHKLVVNATHEGLHRGASDAVEPDAGGLAVAALAGRRPAHDVPERPPVADVLAEHVRVDVALSQARVVGLGVRRQRGRVEEEEEVRLENAPTWERGRVSWRVRGLADSDAPMKLRRWLCPLTASRWLACVSIRRARCAFIRSSSSGRVATCADHASSIALP
jgi:hypothetical protein